MKKTPQLLFILLFFSGNLFAQEYCREILAQAEQACNLDSLNDALSRLKAVETCDYQNHLIRERLALQDSIFARITRQREVAVKNEQIAIAALDKAEQERKKAEKARKEAIIARDSTEKARIRAVQSEAEAISQREKADSARLAAELATRKALVNDLAFKADKAPNRSTTFRLLEMAARIDPGNRPIEQQLFQNYYGSKGFYSFQLNGHTRAVNSVAFSPDGNQLISTGEDQTIRVWDVKGQRELYAFTQQGPSASFAGFSPDGSKILAVRGTAVLLWDVSADPSKMPPNEVSTFLKGHTANVTAAAFSPKGNKIASAAVDGSIKIWDVNTQKEDFPTAGHSSNALSVNFSPDGSKLVSTSLEDIIVWNVADGKKRFSLTGHTQPVNAAVFSPDGTRIASASSDKSIKIWDVASQREIMTLLGHTDEVSDVRFSPDGSRLLSASYDKTVKIWDASTGVELYSLRGSGGALSTAAFSPDGGKAATSSADREITVWDLTVKPDDFPIAWRPKDIQAISLSADRSIVLAATKKEITAWDVKNQKKLCSIEAESKATGRLLDQTSNLNAAAISPDGTKAVTASNVIRVWDLSSQTELFALTGHKGEVNAVSYSTDGARIVSASDDGTVKLWNADTRKELASLSGPPGRLAQSFMLTRDDSKIIALFEFDGNQPERTFPEGESNLEMFSGEAIVWDVGKQTKILSSRDLELGPVEVTSAAISPDGSKIAVGFITMQTMQRGIKIWDISRKKPRLLFHNPEMHAGSEGDKIITLAFSPDGKELASGGSTGDILLSEVNDSDGHWLVKNSGRTKVKAVSFSDDGKEIMAILSDGSILIWNRTSVKRDRSSGIVVRIPPHRSKVVSAALSPDGALVASASDSKDLKLWNRTTASVDTTFTGFSKSIEFVTFSADNKKLAALYDGTAKVWSLDNKMELFTGPGANFVALSPNGAQLATASNGYRVKIWNVESPEDSILLSGHQGAINYAAFSTDGAHFASASSDSTVRIWPLAKKPAKPAVLKLPAEASSLAFSPDGKRLATLSGDSIRVWGLDSLKALFTVPGRGFVHFSPDGTKIVSNYKEEQIEAITVRDASAGALSWFSKDNQLITAFFHPNPKIAQLIGITNESIETWFLDPKSLVAGAEEKYQINELLPHQIREYGLENSFPYAGILDADGMPMPLIQEGKPIKMERYAEYFSEQATRTQDDAQREKYQKIAEAINEALEQMEDK